MRRSDDHQKIRANRDRCEEMRLIQSEIATCECGASVRKDATGQWQHIGDCKHIDTVIKEFYSGR